jgi:tetratricopeptide (TPR) repeat protein
LKLGDVFRSEGQLREASEYYQSAIKLDSDSAALRERLGERHDQQRNTANSNFMTETAADLYLRQGHVDRARTIYLHLLKQNPENNRLQEKLRDCNG